MPNHGARLRWPCRNRETPLTPWSSFARRPAYPTDPKAQFNAANALVQAEIRRKAQRSACGPALRQPVAGRATPTSNWRALVGDHAAALPHLEEAARLRPDSPGIQFNLAELLTDLQRL